MRANVFSEAISFFVLYYLVCHPASGYRSNVWIVLFTGCVSQYSMGCQLASEEAHEQRQYITSVQYACYTIPDVVRLFISAVRSSHLT